MEEEITVLYVDDEPALLEIARLFLEQTGNFRVSTVTSAQDALGSSRIPLFDAIISDYQMPNMDGIAFLKEVRSRYGEIPFILFTGRGREEVVIEAINNGADFYLQKGGDPTAQFAELAHKIRQAVAHKKAELSRIESEKRLADIIDFLPDATFAIDTAGTVISWNHAIGEMTGIPAAEMLGKGNYEYAIPLYGTRRKILIDLVFESDETITRDYAHITRDKGTLIGEKQLSRPMGNVINLMGKASPLYNREGRIVGAIETIRDITQREQDAEQIAQKTKTLSIINNIVMVANQHRTIDDYTKSVLSLTIELLHYDAGGIYLVNPDQKTARIISSKNLDYPFVKEVDNIDIRTPPYDTVFIRGEPVLVDNFTAVLPEAAAVSGFRAVASIPIVSQDRIIGALNVASKKKATLSPDDVGILITIGRELGNALTRIKTELALRENEERLQLLIRHAPVALAMLDRELRYITASNRWNADYHLGDRDLTGQSHLGIFPELTEEIRGVLRRSLTGEIISANEDPFQRQDGTIQWLAWEVRPWYTAGHEIGGIIIFSEDITRRKNAEDELRTSEEKYRQLFEISGDALFVTENVTGKIIGVNEAAVRMYGYSRDELLTLCNSDLSAEPGKTLGIMAIDSQDRVKVPVRYHRKKDGTIFPVEITVSFFTWDGRGVNIGSIRDITDRMLSDSALRHSNEKLNLLSSVTRHDIRNQITILRGYATLAQRAGPAPVIGGYLKNIDTAAATISRQIEFTRNYQDIGIHAPGWYRLCDILTRVKPKDIAVSCSCGDLKIFADPMLEKVFFNLFDNAIRHGDHVTKIDIGCQVPKENCVILVEDDGTGIPADEKEKIFEKGYGKNTGLGLFLAREILAITGITIRETGTPGKGAKFEIAVPKGQFRSAKQN